MEKPTLLTKEEATDLLSDGSGYIAYWAGVRRAVTEEDSIVELTLVDYDSKKEYTITVQDIREAAYRVVNEKLANSSVISDIAQGDYDAVSADVVIQVAALGEVVYG